MEERDERQKDMCVSVHGHGTPPLSRTGINRQVETGVGRAEGIREIYCNTCKADKNKGNQFKNHNSTA